MTNEAQLIRRIQRALAPRRKPADLRLGIGDDAALLRPLPGHDYVFSCDAFLEDVHFLARVHPPDAVGYKALARAASDLAAMGARPRFFFLTLTLPASRTGGWLDGFLAGMARAARKFRLTLAGGDTSRPAKHAGVAISIAVVGEVPAGAAITRSGARPGDLIYASGTLGAAQLGLDLILRGAWRQEKWRHLLRPHCYPQLRLELGEWLAHHRLASSMIDTSDGLSTDISHLCESSGVGARLFESSIPAVRVPAQLAAKGFSAERMALHGGEDYELLFTVPRRLARRVPAAFRGVTLSCIGEIVRGRKIELVNANGGASRLEPLGWDHFGHVD